jgi:signal transduction histidine kinase
VLLPRTEQVPLAETAWAQSLACQASLALQLGLLSAEREAAALRKERARIAREIHDGIAQAFVGIQRRLLSASASADWVAVAGAVELAKDGLAEARRTMQALGPRQLGDMAFLVAVQDIAAKVIPRNIEFLLSTKGAWPALSPEREANLFRVVQEAFNNVARHSFATQVTLDVSSTPGELSLLIQDNGCGFDVSGTEAGFGLAYMRQRIDTIDGILTVSSAPGSGTQIHIRLPHG